MATFVLVHGAWHGGWCWWKVEPLLRQSGGSVYAPSLTGMGERSHLAAYIDPAAINLDLHIKDVRELLESEGLEEVILVGHAYAGMVITGVAEACPQRLDHLVYVTAWCLGTVRLWLTSLMRYAAQTSPPESEPPSTTGRNFCGRPPLSRKSAAAGASPILRTSPGCCPAYALNRSPPLPNR